MYVYIYIYIYRYVCIIFDWLFQAFHSIAKCVAALTVISPSEGTNVVSQFVSDVKVRPHPLCLTDSPEFVAINIYSSILVLNDLLQFG